MTSAEFHQKVGTPFLNALVSEIEAAFDMESIALVQVLSALDRSKIPIADYTGFVMYGSEKIKILLSFYGKERSDTYAGCTITIYSSNIMHCRVFESTIWWLQNSCCFIQKKKKNKTAEVVKMV